MVDLNEISLEEFDMIQWISMLGNTREKQVEVIQDLLRHASWDGMSEEDRKICRDALKYLRSQN